MSDVQVRSCVDDCAQIRVGRLLRPKAGDAMLPDCPHSWADHCPGKRRCTWRYCLVKGCGHVEDRNQPDHCYDLPKPETKGKKP